jgi:hypothetical protein
MTMMQEAEDIWRQYKEKGYIEYEVADNNDKEKENPVDPPASAPSQVYPAPRQRRGRPEVARKSGTTKRLSWMSYLLPAKLK